MYLHPFTILLNIIESWAIHGGYVFLYIMSVLEALPLVGTIVPGHTTVVVAGFLAQLKILNIWIVIVLASLGAVTGDLISFYLGRRYGMRFVDRFKNHFFFKSEHIERTRTLVSTHTGKALLIGRFNPLTRSFVPFLVGASDAPVGRFWVFNIIGGVSWATLSVLVGYVFGFGYHAAALFFGKAAMIATVLAIIFIWGYRFVNMRFHIFRRYELFSLIVCVITLWALFETIQDAWAAHSFMANFDIWVNVFMAKHVGHAVGKVGSLVSILGSTAVTGGLGILVGTYFLWKKKWRSAAIAILAILSTGTMVALLKSFFLRVRPENALQVIVNDPSFPSGHAALSAAFFGILIYLFAPKIKNWISREVFIVFCVLFFLAIGISRLIMNVHWASDVIAGWSLGLFCTTASILIIRYVGALIQRKTDN